MAWNLAACEAEKLVYEGWLLYDMSYVEEALTKAEKAISIQRSFEAFFLKAYVLADKNLDPDESACVAQVLEEALKCPSDGLRKGQVTTIFNYFLNLLFSHFCYDISSGFEQPRECLHRLYDARSS